MTLYDRQRLGTIGYNFIQQAIADALTEAQANGEGGLDMATIAVKAGLPEVSGRWDAMFYFLTGMEAAGEIVNDSPGAGPHSWRLA